MKILIDARLYGLENAGLGRYVINLVSELSKIDKRNEYVILLRKKYFEDLSLPKNWTKVLADFKHYSFLEQVYLPKIIRSIKPDIAHFPHFNIPIFYNGKFIVTIHDMLMHKQKGFEATTLDPIRYLIKRTMYKLVFRQAVVKADQIIVPSYAVKSELVNYYRIGGEKVEVIYEG